MVASSLIGRQGRQAGPILVSQITALKTAPQIITEGNGIIHHLFLEQDTNNNEDIYFKLYNKKSAVTVASDDPDWQFLNSDNALWRHVFFKPAMGTFTGGLQVGCSPNKGPSATNPTGAGGYVDVFWERI